MPRGESGIKDLLDPFSIHRCPYQFEAFGVCSPYITNLPIGGFDGSPTKRTAIHHYGCPTFCRYFLNMFQRNLRGRRVEINPAPIVRPARIVCSAGYGQATWGLAIGIHYIDFTTPFNANAKRNTGAVGEQMAEAVIASANVSQLHRSRSVGVAYPGFVAARTIRFEDNLFPIGPVARLPLVTSRKYEFCWGIGFPFLRRDLLYARCWNRGCSWKKPIGNPDGKWRDCRCPRYRSPTSAACRSRIPQFSKDFLRLDIPVCFHRPPRLDSTHPNLRA